MSHDKKEKKHKNDSQITADDLPGTTTNTLYDITRVYAAGGDGPAIVQVNPDPMWLTGFVVIITALQMPGLIVLNHPYKVVRVNAVGGNTGDYNLQEEDETGVACIPWNNNANGDGANPGTIVLR